MTEHINRREFLRVAGFGAVAVSAIGGCSPQLPREPESRIFYVGTFTRGESKGIYRCTFDLETGAAEISGATNGIENPSFLALDPGGQHLYATGELPESQAGSGGAVHAFSIDSSAVGLRHINAAPSGGGPAYVTTSPQGGHVLAANYGGGSVAVLPIRDDGGVEAASDLVQHEGSSVNPRRQEGPHPHAVVMDDAGRYAFVVDLGLDRIMIYRFNDADGTLTPADQPWADVAPGAGPRHMAFHPDGNRAYVINELNSTVTAFDYDADIGALSEIQTITTLPENFSGENYPADIHVHPNGRYLYGSNRGHDSIVVYAIDPDSGRLSVVHHESTGGEWPRNFGIHPSGRYLLAANQNTDDINIFSLDEESGRLTPTEHSLQIPSPVCIRFVGS